MGAYRPYYQRAGAALERYSQPFTSADVSAYMNPYIKGALDPAAREIRDQGAMRLNELRSTRSMRDAFGGSRSAILESELNRNIDTSLKDLYAQGYAQAFESGANRWEADRGAALQESQAYAALGGLYQNSNAADINTLMATGAQDRNIRQAMADFDYQQFTEERDWDVRNLSGLLAAIQGIEGSYSTTTTTEQKSGSSGKWSGILGLVGTAIGAYYGGGAGAQMGGQIGGAVGGAIDSRSGSGSGGPKA